MPETYTQVSAFCRLAGHYPRLIKGFTNLAHPLYDVLGKEVKMGPVDLPPEAWEAMNILKGKVQSMPVLVFPDFNKPFLLETDASKEGLGVVLQVGVPHAEMEHHGALQGVPRILTVCGANR